MIPLSPIIGIATYGFKAISMLFAQRNKQKHELALDNQALLAGTDRSRAAARKDQSKEASIARRTVIISFTLALVVMPVIAPLFGIGVDVSWHEIDPGWLWFEDVETVQWKHVGSTAKVIAIAPVLYDLYALIIGYYFGGKVGK